MIGSSISLLIIQYNGLIKGTALENAKIYNESISLIFIL